MLEWRSQRPLSKSHPCTLRYLLENTTGKPFSINFYRHFTKFVEAYPIPDQTAETCGRGYATQIITRHGTGSTLITDEGQSFMSNFFRKTFKILKISKLRTSPFHAISHGFIKRWHDLCIRVYHIIYTLPTPIRTHWFYFS